MPTNNAHRVEAEHVEKASNANSNSSDSSATLGYDYSGLDEITAPAEDQPTGRRLAYKRTTPETAEQQEQHDTERRESIGLDELEAAPPDQNPEDNEIYQRSNLENERAQDHAAARRESAGRASTEETAESREVARARQVLSQIYVHSYLIFFSILGVLARLGLVALTSYPGAPLTTTVVWANVSGSLIMGFLREDRLLFRRHWHASLSTTRKARRSPESGTSDESELEDDIEAATEAYVTTRSTVHGFIGLTVGFCGTLTSFADVIRDAFLAIANDLDTAAVSTRLSTGRLQPRPDGYSVLAAIAVLWIEVSMSLAALSLGAHLAIASHRWADRLPMISFEPPMNILTVFVGCGAWIGAIATAIWPPHGAWRGEAIFAVVFAPLGAVLRFHLSKRLNPKFASFPLGTFVANVFGTCILGLVWDLQHSSPGSSPISCQVLQGVADGFCGGLTTVSTWVLELKALRVRHAYIYAVASLGLSLACLVTIMGSLRWTTGLGLVSCKI